ncbi:MAG: hypothetical protein JGK24_03520 [Microcoleus sp. PH2017_29_MFU_D_A]|uniref:hypothetical protein n=1 Tax=unclassified Microcoleus TaxID=2642155 RepID=UPI001DCAFF29|nr:MULTISPECIES: hypothetical protein [unclassified Microcoleus]MCC3420672.1 hypothetical protein [Microcoleus sp. PH2017_07_MST_O_A]MCC3444392.1 hypothetical protein [Microcoleus sp. PH2017_03_ELD_O_A]MCC3467041.1 hypothetical protein [Microcoleus sp. PH2017_06_SFM_O_A]MCC3506274.1 hypothetical protein [Microcoleus sp. PH2017_19_SFW_U_A]MCC3511879.1 hypothetical protein [Microcoleus sp. PH2017_17_BER_D_A]TAE15992.1 MAG: hypothetical protein EAZ94_02980 [Oscillatoriales cyanobacterium]
MKLEALTSAAASDVGYWAVRDRLPEEQVILDPNTLLEPPAPENPKRLAIVVDRTLESGLIANAVAIVSGGLQCEAFGSPIPDAHGNL